LVDCDADCLVYVVAADGPTCHTGAATCFFRTLALEGDELAVRDDEVSVAHLLGRLERTLEMRRTAAVEASYVRTLYDGGAEKIGAKLREEADELARAVASETPE